MLHGRFMAASWPLLGALGKQFSEDCSSSDLESDRETLCGRHSLPAIEVLSLSQVDYPESQ